MKKIKDYIGDLDLWFSRLVRYRAAGKGGFAQCFTCSTIDSVVMMDNGHYLDRAWMGTRFDEDNCRIQCRKCNRMMDGNTERYGMLLKKEIGEERFKALQEKMSNTFDMNEDEIKAEISKCRRECRRLRKEKGF